MVVSPLSSFWKEGSCDTIVYQLSTSTRIPLVYLNKNTIVNFNNKA